MIRKAKLFLAALSMAFVSYAQSIVVSPNRTESLTILGFYTSSPPQIDGILNDVGWNIPTSSPLATSGGAGFNGTSFPTTGDLYTTLVREEINTLDGGTDFPSTPPVNPFTSYSQYSATIGVMWDDNYLYVATKVRDSVVAANTFLNPYSGVSFFLNNVNGRSASTPLSSSFPRNFNTKRDLQFFVEPNGISGLTTAYSPGNFDTPYYGIPVPDNEYTFAIKKNTDGYIVEGKIAWKYINTEFVNMSDGTYSDNKWKPSKTRPALGFDMEVIIPKRDVTGIESFLMWNQCCFNANWTQSQFYGYLQLCGDNTGTICPNSINVSTSPTAITTSTYKSYVSASVSPSNASHNIIWSVQGTESGLPVASITPVSGVITPLRSGVITITGTSKECTSISAYSIMTISGQILPSSIDISPCIPSPATTLGAHGFALSSIITPANAANKSLIWTVQPDSVAVIDKNRSFVPMNTNSVVTITATSVANPLVKTSASVTVYQDLSIINVTTLGISPNTNYIGQPGDTILFSATVSPLNAIDEYIYWTSSDENVLIFSYQIQNKAVFIKGTFTGIVTVTGTAINGGVKAYSVITVSGVNPVLASSVSIQQISATGGSRLFYADILPSNTTNKNVTWTSSNASVGTINSSGLFTELSVGITTITATSIANPSISGSFFITVTGGSAIISPNRTEALTITGAYTSAPPVIDGILDDYAWISGAGYNGTSFPVTGDLNTTLLREQINTLDLGTVAPAIPPANPFSNYTPFSATFGLGWDSVYLYVAVKVVDPISAADTSLFNRYSGIDIFFNNGNGRTGLGDPISEYYPRKFNTNGDLAIQISPSTDFAGSSVCFPDNFNLQNYGISLVPMKYRFIMKKTSDGYIVEGRIEWSNLNKEFINVDTGEYFDAKWKPSNTRPIMGFDMDMMIPKPDFSGVDSKLSWNQCCYDANWSRSQFYGYMKLTGINTGTICPNSVNVSLSPAVISTPLGKAYASATILPDYANKNVEWSVQGVDGSGIPIASISSTGIITPLGNGIVTITGVSDRCPAFFASAILSISGQVLPTSVSVYPGESMILLGNSLSFSATVAPANVANKGVSWSVSPSNLASITSDGYFTAIGNGVVTITATSLADSSVSGNSIIDIRDFAFNVYMNSIVVVTNQGTIVNWPTIPGISLYCFKYSTDSSFVSNVITVCGLVNPSYTITGLPEGSGLRTSGTNQTIYWQVAGIDDANGKTYWSAVQKTELSSGVMNIKTVAVDQPKLYPNPSSDLIHISGLKANDEVLIYDVHGSLVLKSNSSDINVTSLTNGIYVVRVNGKNLRFAKQ